MDKESFPKWRYHHAGVICDGRLQQSRAWTGRLIQQLIDLIREQIEYEVSRVYLFGHSAGAQLLARICAYSPLSGVDSVIVANPSSYVLPLFDEPAPFGFKNIFSRARDISKLRDYLAAPMTIYVGIEDTQDLYLSLSKYSMQQGRNRIERGRNLYRLGYQVAQAYRFRFNWRLVEIPGVGHSSREMLDCENFSKAVNSRQNERQLGRRRPHM
jgi:pimeloyl-ACP methyl ester carboxylesterase